MIIANNKMFQLLYETKLRKGIVLSNKLKSIIDGSLIKYNNCIFLDYFYSANPHIKRANFADDVGYECFINGFHIDDYSKNNYLYQTLLFTNKFIEMWKNQLDINLLEIIISQTEHGYHFTAHSRCNKETWIDINEIENFEEAVLIIRPANNAEK